MKFRMWHRIVPAALILVMVLSSPITACSGNSNTPSPPPTTNSDGSITYYLKADKMKFDNDRMTVPASTKVTIVFTNAEGILHNFALYTERFASDPIFRGQLISKTTIEYTFTTPSEPGTYSFRCDLHPVMYGEFIVN
ncbi:cupredoxin domain-containing protein [Dehalogenimonas sp. THU2]|uniref:cupredoxin domain-containing protein n=1 Tax=Dehalogenimonas sp. THU2 TaxID=3151121 RepID=UPI003218A581